jgi:hypothetical protein
MIGKWGMDIATTVERWCRGLYTIAALMLLHVCFFVALHLLHLLLLLLLLLFPLYLVMLSLRRGQR